MASLKIFLVFALGQCVFSGKLMKKYCDSGSESFNACVTDVVRDYFKEHSGGLPEHNLKAVDPVNVPEIIIDDRKLGFKLIYKNVKLTGFKDAIISDFKIDPENRRAEFDMKFDIDAQGDVTMELTQGKTYSGTFKYDGTVKANTKYSYTEKKESNGERVYFIGPETITCEASNGKENYNQELNDTYEKDPDTQTLRDKFENATFAKEYNEKALCKIAKLVFQEVVDVIRTLAKMGA